MNHLFWKISADQGVSIASYLFVLLCTYNKALTNKLLWKAMKPAMNQFPNFQLQNLHGCMWVAAMQGFTVNIIIYIDLLRFL